MIFFFFLTSIGVPGSVEGLSANAPEGSNKVLTISWHVPADSVGVISLYYVIVTNYSFDPVSSVTIPGDETSANVTGLGRPTPKLT